MAKSMRMPSPALVVAIVALFVALGGTGYAALQIPSKSVGTPQLKRGAVTSPKLKNQAVTRAKLRSGAVGTAQLGNNVVTGAKLNESSLGTVPQASQATTATTAGHANTATHANTAGHANTATSATNASTVEGLTVRRFNYSVNTNGPLTELLSVNGYTLNASCTAGDISFTITGPPAPAVPEINGAAFNTATNTVTNDVGATFQGSTINLLPDVDDDVVGHAEVINTAASSGSPSLTLTYGADELVGGQCTLTGHVVSG